MKAFVLFIVIVPITAMLADLALWRLHAYVPAVPVLALHDAILVWFCFLAMVYSVKKMINICWSGV